MTDNEFSPKELHIKAGQMVLGPLAYFLLGRSEIPRNTRLALAIGALGVYLITSEVLLLLFS